MGKYLSHKHENLSLISKKPQKKARWGATHMQSQYLGSEGRGMPVSLAKARSRFIRGYLRGGGGEQWKKTLDIDLWLQQA